MLRCQKEGESIAAMSAAMITSAKRLNGHGVEYKRTYLGRDENERFTRML